MPQPPLREQNELDVWTDRRPFSTTEQREHDESHRLSKVSTKKEVREFLISRRAHISPEQVEVICYDQDRRVPGLRRRESRNWPVSASTTTRGWTRVHP